MHREIFDQDHELFRGQVKRFLEKEVVPKISHWNETGICDRETWRRLGAQGLVAPSAPVEYGGSGADFLYDAIVIEELAYVRAHALMVSLHSGVCLPYIATFGSEEQKRKYLPGAVSGEILLGICMSEPAAGSDLQNIRTTAVRDGDDYVLNGSKTFISHGQLGDLFIVAAKTDPKAAPAHTGISLILVEATAPGFPSIPPLLLAGMKAPQLSGGKPSPSAISPMARGCAIGSIKTNIGHTEPVSGLAGLMKATLALEHDLVPPSLHAAELNPEIPDPSRHFPSPSCSRLGSFRPPTARATFPSVSDPVSPYAAVSGAGPLPSPSSTMIAARPVPYFTPGAVAAARRVPSEIRAAPRRSSPRTLPA